MASLLSQATAGTPKVSPMSATAAKVSPFSAKPSTTMTGPYQSTVGTGQYQSTVPSSGVRAVSPTTNVSKPSTTIPASQQSRTPSAGSYHGVSITPGTDAEVATQIAKINAANAGKNNTSTPTYPGLVGQNIQAQNTQNTQNTQTNTQASVPPPAPQGFSDYVGNIGTTAGALNNTATLLGQQGQVTPEEQAAKNKLAGVPGLLGSTDASIENQPGEFAFQMGREAVAGRNIEAMRQSLADQANAYATTRQANTAAYTAQANAQNAAGGLYGSAATLGTPQVVSPGQAVFNPLTGAYTNASSGGSNPATAPSGVDQNSWNQYIQAYATGNVSAIPSSITGNANLSGQLQAAVSAKNPGFDYATATGSAAARNSNAGTAGTATPQAYQAIYQNALNDYTNLKQSVQNVDQFGNLLTQHMGGINPTDVKYANQTIGQIRSQLSSADQASYDTTLAALRSKISGMLAIGGSETPTAITADAQKILDGSLPLGSLSAVLSRIQNEGNILLNNQAQKVNDAKTGTMGSNGSSTAGSGGSTGGSGAITWDSILGH